MTLPRLPAHAPGMRIGLFGGSFNPPHEGHRLASLIALKRLGLDRVWWMVTPGNPLKSNGHLPALAARVQAAKLVANHPRIDVTGFEAQIGTRFTYDTLCWLKRHCPQVDFVWLMGADNLRQFHRWQHWREIAALIPIAVIDRPDSTLRAGGGQAGHVLARHRLDESDAMLLPGHATPAFVFLHGPRSPLSSTALREAGKGLA
ncbi:nicotinate-nucleotide adenylyltransferase [Methylovirgula sp. 4M-Z18]|uniref:nicotinate-nucleotide adenylyltransferase n=1 Tax=Methylovirgula sp. 4M-Z18 TaxID=2293567 RepID=UPI000E2F9773|nr:nicotinate-nucleotide adenylyltransferase [Methylovirgula sp. 4M-Z18]RFB78645.1 nicotinate-nucleotide adenylyltransferase [Methylovirgula sp. 4M-Z18]